MSQETNFKYTLAAWLESFRIMAKYYPGGEQETWPFHAEHDELYGIAVSLLPEDSDDGKRLAELGWEIGEQKTWVKNT